MGWSWATCTHPRLWSFGFASAAVNKSSYKDWNKGTKSRLKRLLDFQWCRRQLNEHTSSSTMSPSTRFNPASVETTKRKQLLQNNDMADLVFFPHFLLCAYLHWCQKCQGPVHRPHHSLWKQKLKSWKNIYFHLGLDNACCKITSLTWHFCCGLNKREFKLKCYLFAKINPS